MCRQSRGRSSCSGCDACVGAFTVTHSCIRCSLRVCFRITRLGRRYHGFSATDHPKLMLVKGRNWPKTGNREVRFWPIAAGDKWQLLADSRHCQRPLLARGCRLGPSKKGIYDACAEVTIGAVCWWAQMGARQLAAAKFRTIVFRYPHHLARIYRRAAWRSKHPGQ